MNTASSRRWFSLSTPPLHIAALIVAVGAGIAAAQPAHAPGTPPGPGHAPPAPSGSAPAPPPPASTPQAGGAATVDTQGPIEHGPAAQRDRRHLRAGYWWRYLRGQGSGTVASGGGARAGGVPASPSAVLATHNYDGSVTVTWAMASGAGALGDVYQVGRRLPEQRDFWLIGETTVPSFTDRTIPARVRNAQYRVVVRRGGAEGRGGVYGPVSAIASANLNHAWAKTAQPSPAAGKEQPAAMPEAPADAPKEALPAATGEPGREPASKPSPEKPPEPAPPSTPKKEKQP